MGQFWKQFFEASANVSLSGVEEREEDDDEGSYAQSYDQTSNYATSQYEEETQHAERQDRQAHAAYDEDDSLLDNPDISGSTPRAPQPKSKPNFADYPLPYESLKQELKGGDDQLDDETETLPTTPGPQRIPDMSMTPTSSPRDQPTNMLSTKRGGENKLLHRVLDKNYRVQATPLTSRRKETKTPAKQPTWRDQDSPMSSPPAAAPELRAEIFSSPIRQQFQPNAPRTPGVSVQPSAKKKKSSDVFAKPAKKDKDEITWESDSDEDPEGVYRELGMSPPKTIQFSLPQSRLLQTPAREASKRIVEDLLMTAGVGFEDEEGGDSPSVVGGRKEMDDSF